MRRARFLIIFFALLAVSETLLMIPVVDRYLVEPITSAIAAVSGRLLSLIGEQAAMSGTVIRGTCFSVEIRNGCNALEVSVFLIAAIVAFPSRWKARLAALGSGLVALQLVNLLRVVSLYWIGCHHSTWFEPFHTMIWPTLIFGATIGFFMLWFAREESHLAA